MIEEEGRVGWREGMQVSRARDKREMGGGREGRYKFTHYNSNPEEGTWRVEARRHVLSGEMLGGRDGGGWEGEAACRREGRERLRKRG